MIRWRCEQEDAELSVLKLKPADKVTHINYYSSSSSLSRTRHRDGDISGAPDECQGGWETCTLSKQMHR